jgi:AcrR family transcriptional regulator
MPTAIATNKGAATREFILDRAYDLACAAGLESLSIGVLAQSASMSKSGVFAHFGSREDLQLAVLEVAGQRFIEHVLTPALKSPRGLVRLRAIIINWFDWVRNKSGGCLLLSAVSEYDDRPGPLRDRVIEHQQRWRAELARAVQIARDSGELSAATEPLQIAFEIYAIAVMVHHDAGLFGFDEAVARGCVALERLLKSCSA